MPSPDRDRGPGILVPPPVAYLSAFGVGLAMERALPSPKPPAWLRLLGGAAGALSLLALDSRAMLRFHRRKTPFNPTRPATALVTDGPYRFTRNPMYLGMGGAHAGAAVAAGALWSLAALPLALTAIDRLIIPREERHLAQSFGDEYEQYRRRVPRWL